MQLNPGSLIMPIKTKISLVALTLSALLTIPAYAASTSSALHSASEPMNAVVQTESDKANALFETIFMENIMASPISQTYMGIKQDYDKWDELGDAADDKALARTKKQLAQVNLIDAAKLDPQTNLSLTLLKQNLQNDIEDDQWPPYI